MIARHQIVGRTKKDKLLLSHAQFNQFDELKILVEAGQLVDIDVRDTKLNDHLTALHWAVLNGDYRIIEFLLRNGADPLALDAHGCHAFHHIFNMGSAQETRENITKITKLLIKYSKKKINFKDISAHPKFNEGRAEVEMYQDAVKAISDWGRAPQAQPRQQPRAAEQSPHRAQQKPRVPEEQQRWVPQEQQRHALEEQRHRFQQPPQHQVSQGQKRRVIQEPERQAPQKQQRVAQYAPLAASSRSSAALFNPEQSRRAARRLAEERQVQASKKVEAKEQPQDACVIC